MAVATIHIVHTKVLAKILIKEVKKMKITFLLKRTPFLVIILIGIFTGSIAYASVNIIFNQNDAKPHEFPKNQYGETYGSALDATPQEKEPDLIKAIGEDGTIGYVRSSELIGELPKSPQEALAQQEKGNNGREISLYDVDGRTIKGKFKITPDSIHSGENLN